MLSNLNIWQDDILIKTLKEGGVVIMPTDTIYGIVGKAESRDTIERIYEIRRRSPDKPCIILISKIEDLLNFKIILTPEQEKEILSEQDKPTSFILDCKNDEFEYLHRGTNTLAFRIPSSDDLKSLLKNTGPLIAPSANPEGLPPAKDIDEAKKYFDNNVDFYLDVGEIKGEASKIIKIDKDGKVIIIRV